MRFYVEAKIGLAVGVEVTAKSLDDAVAKAKTYVLSDFVEILGDHNDSNFKLSGVFEAGGAPKA